MVLAYLADNTQTIPNAYYEGMDDAISTAYQMGLTNGAANTNLDNVSITYTVKHTHGSGCYPVRSLSIDSNRQDNGSDGKRQTRTTGHCTACGKYFDSGWEDNSEGYSKTIGYVQNIYMGHSCNPSLICGLVEGMRTTSDATTLKSGDEVVSATITY